MKMSEFPAASCTCNSMRFYNTDYHYQRDYNLGCCFVETVALFIQSVSQNGNYKAILYPPLEVTSCLYAQKNQDKITAWNSERCSYI